MMNDQTITALIRAALDEDIGTGDVTTLALVPPEARTRAVIVARHACRVAGTDIARRVFHALDPELSVTTVVPDGLPAKAGSHIVTLSGRAASILTAERVALNFLQRLTGVATLTAMFVERVAVHGVKLLDTRKTTPGWRGLEKYAVRCGGGVNHRMGLYDRVMIKDNHRRFWAGNSMRSLADAVHAARAAFPGIAVEVEVENETDMRDALDARPEWILLDNMAPAAMRRCATINAGTARLEASGGITLDTIDAVAASGIDAVSLGCLTHSAPATDLSLEFEDLTSDGNGS